MRSRQISQNNWQIEIRYFSKLIEYLYNIIFKFRIIAGFGRLWRELLKIFPIVLIYMLSPVPRRIKIQFCESLIRGELSPPYTIAAKP